MKKALLIIDVQKSAAGDSDLPEKIEKLQDGYEYVFVSKFVGKDSALVRLTEFEGYEDERLCFVPAPHAVVFEKGGYSSYLPRMDDFDEVHLCGFDTDACVYKTAMDLMERGVRPVVLSAYCASKNETYHRAGMLLIERNIGRGNIL